MLRRLIIFLIRRKLKLKKYELFQFVNRKSLWNKYYFGKNYLFKIEYEDDNYSIEDIKPANVSLNWLLSGECKIKKIGVKA